MKALSKAINSVLRSTADLVAIVGTRIHKGSAPDETLLPFMTFAPQGTGAPECSTENQQVASLVWRFQIRTTSEALAQVAKGLIERAFVPLLLLDVGTHLATLVQDGEVFEEPDREPDGTVVWQGAIDLVFVVQRDPTVKET